MPGGWLGGRLPALLRLGSSIVDEAGADLAAQVHRRVAWRAIDAGHHLPWLAAPARNLERRCKQGRHRTGAACLTQCQLAIIDVKATAFCFARLALL